MRRIFQIVPLLLTVSVLTACGSASSENKSAAAEGTVIYDLNAKRTKMKAEPWTASSDSPQKNAEEMISVMSDGASDGEYSHPIPKEIRTDGITYDEATKALKVSFTPAYQNLKGTDEAMIRSAAVKSLLSLDGIDSVEFLVNQMTLTDSLGNVVGAMDDNTFVMSMAGDDMPVQEANLVLYYPDASGEKLVREERQATYNSNIPLGRVVMQQLCRKPATDGAYPAFSDSVQVNSLTVANGICYVDLDSGFLVKNKNVTTKAAVYAVVDSLTELPGVSRVQLSVGGENLLPDGASPDSGTNYLYERDESLILDPDKSDS